MMVFMFFVTRKSGEGYEETELDRMQQEHLDNNRRLYHARLVKAVGPCSDPEKVKRGIMLFDLQTTEGLEAHFQDDPFVQEGLMGIQAWRVEVPRIELGAPEESGISQHTLALLEATSEAGEAVAVDAARYLHLSEAQRPAVVAVSVDPGPIRLAMLFAESDVESVQTLVDTDPALGTGALRARVFRQWMGKGMLR